MGAITEILATDGTLRASDSYGIVTKRRIG